LALQTTLLGLAITIILALVAALVAPLLVDWTHYRPLIEAEASHLIGTDVRVKGAIDARLLPSPQLTLHDIEIGTGANTVRARSLGIEFALTPLMRGQWQASEMHLASPQIRLALDASGHLQAPKLAIAFNPDALSIDRLSIEDGTVTLSDAGSGAKIVLEKFWLNGAVRSLIGPFKGEGAAAVGGDLYPFRVSTGRVGADGALNVRLNVDPVSHPVSFAADGSLAFAGGAPRFDGTIKLGRLVAPAAAGAASAAQPWHVSAKIKATAARALLQQAELQYGTGDRTIDLTGTAEFKFGKEPRFDGVLSGRQIDLDRTLADGEGTPLSPAAVVSKLAELSKAAFRSTIPIQIGIGIDQVTLGGNAIQTLRGDMSSDAGGWNLDDFEFHAPGFTKVRLSGRLTVANAGVAFSGPAEVESTDPRALAAWIEGRMAPEKTALRPLRLRGDVTLSHEKLAFEGLTAQFEGKPVSGRLVYAFAAGKRPARLDAVINAPELDIDSALGFGKALLAGSNLARPHDMTIAADIGDATFAGIEARKAVARVKVDGDGFRIDKLSIADLGGGALSASGRIETGGHAPRGKLALDFETRQTAAVASLVAKFVPQAAAPLTDLFAHVQHTKLHATLDVSGAKGAAATVAQLALTGDLDAMHLDADARMSGDWAKPSAADLKIDGSLATPDGAALIKLLRLDRIVAAGKGPGAFKLQVAGPADGDLTIGLRLSAGDLSAESQGRGQISLDQGAKIAGTLQIAKADLQPLRPQASKAVLLPLSLNSRIAIAGRSLTFDDIEAQLAGANLRGRLVVDNASPRSINGELDADTIDAAALIADAIGMPASVADKSAAWAWSSAPFVGGAFGDVSGRIALKATRARLTPQLVTREFSATLRLGNNRIALDNLTGDLAGGRFRGQLSFSTGIDGLDAQGKVALVGADIAALLPAAARPPVTGMIDGRMEIAGAGLSPVALVGSLHGSGNIALNNGQFAGLDPRAFDAVIRAVDHGLAIAPAQISDVVGKALESGALSVKHADSAVTIGAGQIRLNEVKAHSEDADVSLDGSLDLTDGKIDARLVLSGAGEADGARPDIFMALKGPLAAPTRAVDVSALTGWLTLRSLDNQAKQLHALESVAPQPQPSSSQLPIPAQAKPKPPAQMQPRARAAPRAAVKPRVKRAPALPPPLDIKPLPAPSAQPEASVSPQN
jgi:uncharacterized protein involved in outer membrane biogenesis